MASIRDTTLAISVECVDNVFGVPGVVIYDDKTFPISSQGAPVGAGLHPHSSVRPFQSSTPEETLMESDPPQASNEAPWQCRSSTDDDDDDEVPMEVDVQVEDSSSVEEEEVDDAALLRTLKTEAEDLLD